MKRLASARAGASLYSVLLSAVLLMGAVRPLTAAAEDRAVLDVHTAPLCAATMPCERPAVVLTIESVATVPELDAAAGGSRTALGPFLPPRRNDPSQWSPSMDRHDLILGRLDPDHDDSYEYRLPYGDAVTYPVIQGYGAKLSHFGTEQYTVDFGMAVGTPVTAARDGVVVLIEDSHDGTCWRADCARLANFVVVLHSDGTTGEYFHLERGSVVVHTGDAVGRGQVLALSGNTGYSTAPHLHFGVYRTERDGETRSVAVRFLTREGPIGRPRTGARYLNMPRD